MNYVNYLVFSKYAKGSDGHLDANALDDAIRNHNGGEAYYNHYDVRQDALGIDDDLPTFKGARGFCKPAFNLVGFDFDSDGEPQAALNDVKNFITYFGFKYFYLAFSGSKGFHLSIPFEYFNLEADAELPNILRNLAHELKPHFDTLDTTVYNIGRKFRALNSKHPKTNLYKTLVNPDWPLEKITEYAKVRREAWYEPFKTNWYEIPVELVKLIETAKEKTVNDANAITNSAENVSPLEAFDAKICIRRLLEGEIPEGERNTTALILINDFYKTGKSIEHTREVLTPWINRVMPEHRRPEVFEIIKDIYSGKRFYNHGCSEPIKSKQCSAKCPLWAKLTPEKRPLPVDAPKRAFKEGQTSNAKPATEFIRDWLYENGVKITLANNWFINGDHENSIARNVIEDRIFNDSDLVSRKEYRPVSQNRIVSFLNVWQKDERDRRLNSLCEHIAYTGDNDGVVKYLKALLCREPSDLELTVLKHWLWLVKRKINGLKTEREIMVVIAGITNTGKTEAVTRMFKPLKELVDTMMLDSIADERHDFRLTENAIVFFDEMATTRKVNVEALKNKITAKWLNYRPLGKTTRVQGKNLATFIGTSNTRVSDIVRDPTSSRRYYEYWIEQRCDWNAINAIDYLELWRGIDESASAYISGDVVNALAKAQENFRALDSVEDWLEIEELIPPSGVEHEYVKPRQAYQMYMDFLKEQARERQAFGMKRFFNRMIELNLNGRDGKRGNFYKILNPKNNNL